MMFAKLRSALKYLVKKRVDLPKISSSEGKFAWLTKSRSAMPSYFKESFAELKKVSWTTRKETLKLLLGLLIFTAVLMVIIAIFDNLFSQIVKRIFL